MQKEQVTSPKSVKQTVDRAKIYLGSTITRTVSKKIRDRNTRQSPMIDIMISIKKDYENNRFTFVNGHIMKEILRYFGASDEDFIGLEYSGFHLAPDPTLPFRKSRNGRFLIDFDDNSISRLVFQPFVLSKEENFIRDDSGQLRHFRGIQDSIQQNKAFQGLLKFQSLILEGMPVFNRINLVEDFNKWVSTVFQLRTITNNSILGEPAKEGVHSDGVEHTMTTMLYSQNMTADSAISKMHNQNQKTGISWDIINEEHVVGEFQHKSFLDTLLIVDNELKHSVSPVYSINKNSDSYRDMIIFFTRRPKSELHSTYKYDSLKTHPEIPLTFSIL